MGIKVTVKFEGGKELDNAFKQLPTAVARSAALMALRKAAKDLVSGIKGGAPVDTGAGAKTIKARLNKRIKNGVGISIGPDREHYYMSLQEWGTMFMAAHPYIRPAWDEGKDAAVDNLKKLCWEMLVKKIKLLNKKIGLGTITGKEISGLME